MTLFFIGLLYYGYFIPITMIFTGRYEIIFLNSYLTVSNSEIDKIAYLLFFGHLMFVLGYMVFVRKDYVDDVFKKSVEAKFKVNDIGGTVLMSMILFAIAACIIFYRQELLALFSGYAEKIETKYEASTFSFLYKIALMCIAVLLVRLILYSRAFIFYTAAAFVFAVGWSLLTYSKEPIVMGALVLFAGAARFAPKRQLAMIGAAILAAILVLVLFVPAFSRYRATGLLEFISPNDIELSFLYSDAGGTFPTLVLAIRGGELFHLNALWESLFLWIPQGLWPDRPLDAAESFARAVMPGWQPGFGLGFSPFAEGRIRFGLLLGPLLLFLAGFSIAGLQRLAIRYVPASLATALLLVVQGYLMFTMHRGAYSGIFTAMAQFWLPFLALTGVLVVLSRRKGQTW